MARKIRPDYDIPWQKGRQSTVFKLLECVSSVRRVPSETESKASNLSEDRLNFTESKVCNNSTRVLGHSIDKTEPNALVAARMRVARKAG